MKIYSPAYLSPIVTFELHKVKGQLHELPLLVGDKGHEGPGPLPLLLDVGGGHHVVQQGEPRLLPHCLLYDAGEKWSKINIKKKTIQTRSKNVLDIIVVPKIIIIANC